jgi:hypothetical protein
LLDRLLCGSSTGCSPAAGPVGRISSAGRPRCDAIARRLERDLKALIVEAVVPQVGDRPIEVVKLALDKLSPRAP